MVLGLIFLHLRLHGGRLSLQKALQSFQRNTDPYSIRNNDLNKEILDRKSEVRVCSA